MRPVPGRRPVHGRPDDRGGRRGDRRGRAPRAGRPPSDPARQAAYATIAAVHRDDAYANLVLPAMLRDMRLGGRDAAFATELAYGTLRVLGTLDAVLTRAADREVARIDPPARDAMRLGVYQLLHTRVPAHAAVSSTVDLVRSVAPGAAGFANAVLRRVAERDLDAWLAELAPASDADPIGHLALVYNHPQWIVRAFAEALKGDLGETTRLLIADNERPPVHLCARPGRIDPVELADEVGGAPGAFSPYAVYLPGGAPGEVAAVGAGLAHVQDEGSQLVALALAGAELAGGPDARWLDLCAGPGGKAALLAGLAAERGATLTAVEIAEHRAQLVRQAVRGYPATVVHADGRSVGEYPELPAGSFDRVLVDAPCTGLGALRRRPEARWRRQPSDLPPLTRLQRELLVAALRAVRPGGVVGYVTCSPHVVETRVTVAEAIRRAGMEVVELDARPALPAGMPGLQALAGAHSDKLHGPKALAGAHSDKLHGPGDGRSVQLWPHRHGTDAMFLSLLRRPGS